MNAKAEYEAIPIGSEEMSFKPEDRGESRVLSIFHLTPPKAFVLAITIVCVTFATVHFNSHPLTAKGDLLFPTSNPSDVLRGQLQTFKSVCDVKMDSAKCNSDPFLYKICKQCGFLRQSVGHMTTARGSTQRVGMMGQNGVLQGGFQRFDV